MGGAYETTADYWHERGQQLADAEKDGEAVPYYLRALALEPDSGPIWHDLANSYSVLIRRDQTINEDMVVDAYGKAIAYEPDFKDAWYDLADFYAERGRLDEAIDACRRALSLDSANGYLHEHLGDMLIMNKKYFDAATAYNQALQCELCSQDNREKLTQKLRAARSAMVIKR